MTGAHMYYTEYKPPLLTMAENVILTSLRLSRIPPRSLSSVSEDGDDLWDVAASSVSITKACVLVEEVPSYEDVF
ncbi:hypothetical protein JTE90_006500 [Oedothorax gibbosus]|uniref:Uncharacterized protein n=1 Tax=Oedothorax gibbosus TaxID=931172 RepID=A0AAV6VMV8_9ARAC|nr:hypothetical protein JTE90_006500 [Oedothorax gibbosus]